MSIYLKTGKVLPEWTDYNGHMNLAFYIHLFDSSWEVLLEKFNIGENITLSNDLGDLNIKACIVEYIESLDVNNKVEVTNKTISLYNKFV